jgi:Ca-activated chloride channel family protein
MNQSATALLASLPGILILFGGCDRGTSARSATPAASKSPTLELTFTYGSEKEKWINDVTDAFNASAARTSAGKVIHVKAIAKGSGECIDDLLEARTEAHLTSPASAAFVELGNAQSRAKTGGDLLEPAGNLVISPVVIAMWKPMAEAIGWGQRPVGWTDVLALARDPAGWATHGHAEWGQFKFGHTHPQFSNSGLIAVLAEVYAGAGKVRGLTADDVDSPQTGQFVHDIESAIVHYGSSTGFFGRKMFAGGPRYLSAAVLYENMVIEATSANAKLEFPLVAIYPKEGTFWSDHPVGIVQRPWVTAEHKEAAKIYVDYLLAQPQQEKAMRYGFRPGDPKVPLDAATFALANGVDPRQPQSILEVPTADRMDQILRAWHRHKKHARVVLVFDTSGSMSEQGKMPSARAGAQQLISMLDDEDELSLLPFSTTTRWAGRDLKMGASRQKALSTVGSLVADGNTLLYDSIDAGYQYLLEHPAADRIAAVVVLTDGEDTDSRIKLDGLLAKIRGRRESTPVRIFTIGYGSDAKIDVLKRIADESQATFNEGTPQNIHKVFADVATFF